MTIETIGALLAFLLPLAYSPGPGNTFFAAIGATKGLRAAIPALAGYHIATFIVTAAIGMGLGLTVLSNPTFAAILTALASLYVLWLGVQFFRSARTSDSDNAEEASIVRGLGFVDGAIVLLLNPKAYYIIGLLFTQFILPTGDRFAQAVGITAIFTLNNLIAFITWTVAGAILMHAFRSHRTRKWIDYVFAVSLVGVAIWMALPLII